MTMNGLRPCPSCARHVRIVEVACPFCATALEPAEAAPERNVGQPTNRVAYVLLGAAAAAATVAACTGGPDPGPTSSSGGSSSGLTSSSGGGSSSGSTSSGGSSGTTSSSGESSGALPPYGIPPIDAGED